MSQIRVLSDGAYIGDGQMILEVTLHVPWITVLVRNAD